MIQFEEAEERKKPTYIAKDKEINFAYPESQNIFRRLVERGHIGIFLADIKGYLFYVNHALVLMLGYETKDDILGRNLADLVFTDRKIREGFLAKLNQTGAVRDCDLSIVRRDHIRTIVSVTSNLIESDAGEVIGIEGIMHDVTEKTRLEDALLVEKQKLEKLLEFDEAITSIKEFDNLVECVVEKTARILEVEKCSLMMLDDQKKAMSIIGARGLDAGIIRNAEVKPGEMIAGVVLREGQPLLVRNIEYDRRFQRANRPGYLGRSFMIVPVKLGDRVIGVINVADKKAAQGANPQVRINYEEAFGDVDLRILSSIAREVSAALENVRLYRELTSLAVTDPLTHIYNYRQFSKSLEYEIKRSRRNNVPLCVIMIDIDDFKPYNDAFGTEEGDALLKNLGQIFNSQLREIDIVCRYAGDEFAIILPDTDVPGARRAADKIRNAVERFTFKKKVTLSVGVSAFAGEITQYQLIAHADKALNRAKKEGKDRVCVFE